MANESETGESGEAGQEPFRFKAFAVLVAAFGERERDHETQRSWEAFSKPSVADAQALLLAQSLVDAASSAEMTTSLEALRFENRGSVTLKRLHAKSSGFEYKIQILRINPNPRLLEERPVAVATVLNAVRAGVSVLAAAIAADADAKLRIRELLMDGQEFASFERGAIGEMIEDAQAPHRPRRNRL